MAVSAIISNFNGARFLPRLLETLRAQKGVTLEILVVDRHSHDDSLTYLAKQPDVRVLHERPESGLVTGYDVGVPHAQYEHLFFCNEDMWFDPDCLHQLEKRIDLSPLRASRRADPWLSGPMTPPNWIHGGTRFLSLPLEPLQTPHPFRQYDFTRSLGEGEEVPFPCAGAFLIHRQVYEELGGWDRGFFLDHEDVDLFLRAWQANWRCVTVPSAKVYHAVNASNAQQMPTSKQKVSKRRYISGRASLPIIGLKYFTSAALFLPVLIWAAGAANNFLKGRWQFLWWDLLAARESCRRLRGALGCRRERTRQIQRRPGQQFFHVPAFNSIAPR